MYVEYNQNFSFSEILNISKSAQAPVWEEILFWSLALSIFGICGIFANLLTIAIIVSNKRFRTPWFGLIAEHCTYCLLMATSFTTSGFEQFSLYFGTSDLIYNRLSCYLRSLTFYVSVPASAVLTCIIAFDRALALLFPKLYQKNAGRKIAIGSIMITIVVSFVSIITADLTMPNRNSSLVYCYNVFAPLHVTFMAAFAYINCSLITTSVLIYSGIFCVITYRKHKQNAQPTQNDRVDYFLQKQLRLLPMVNTLMVAYCIVGVIPPLITGTVSLIFNGKYLERASQYHIVLKTLLPMIDFVVLFLKITEFRDTVQKWLKLKKATVLPIITTSFH